MMKLNKLYIILCLYVIISVLTIGCSKKDSSNHTNKAHTENNDDHGTENNNHTPNEKTQETNDKAHDVEKDRVPKRSEEHTSELQSRGHLVCRLLIAKKKKKIYICKIK